jgi:hypothetical protein
MQLPSRLAWGGLTTARVISKPKTNASAGKAMPTYVSISSKPPIAYASICPPSPSTTTPNTLKLSTTNTSAPWSSPDARPWTSLSPCFATESRTGSRRCLRISPNHFASARRFPRRRAGSFRPYARHSLMPGCVSRASLLPLGGFFLPFLAS